MHELETTGLRASLIEYLSDRAQRAPGSGISDIVSHARLREGLIPLWVGEGDLPTPDFIRDTGMAALRAGETFYTWQRGIPELRQALARYHERHFGRPFAEEEFLVTGSGMQSIQLALQAVVGNGDEILYFTPAWPNFAAAAQIAGAGPVPVVLDLGDEGWSLDPEKLRAGLTARTKAIFVNSPANPTGWTADLETLIAIRDFARANGLWIIADEIYSRFFYAVRRAPSFMDIVDEDERIVFVNSFSKNWAMTGWRVGWIKAHPSLAQMFENLIQYSTSGVAQFMQKAAVAALDGGDAFVDMQVARARAARDIICTRLAATGRVKLLPPPGAFYLYFEVDGVKDTRAAAKEIVDKTGVGLAPGTAFGPGGATGFRLCFNRKLADIETAAERLAGWIGT
jgi:aspartate/methionine/tyrosine aminotransferase